MIVDIVAAFILIASVVISIVRGFIREVLTIFGLIGGALAAYIGGPLLSPVISGWLGVAEDGSGADKLFDILPYSVLAEILSYAFIFILFVVIFSILSHFLSESVRNIGLGVVDRTLGMVFGLIRGILLLGLLYLPIHFLVQEDQIEDWGWLKDSKSRVYLDATSSWIASFIPSENIGGEQDNSGIGVMHNARQKLEELDILQKNQSDDSDNKQQAIDKIKEGYSKEFRNKMDKLIEKELGDDE